MKAIFKKEYRLSILLIVVFGVFLYTVNHTSIDIIYSITDVHFRYEKQAFLKITYVVLLFIAVALLVTMEKESPFPIKERAKVFREFVMGSVLCFFPGWALHLYAVVNVIQTKSSFQVLEGRFWLYNAADLTLFVGFCLMALWKIKPILHPKDFPDESGNKNELG